MSDSIVESIKELLRTGLIAAIPAVIDGLSNGKVNLELVAVAFLIASLRALEKLLHKSGASSPLDFKALDGLKS